jgi:hypothetical protein
MKLSPFLSLLGILLGSQLAQAEVFVVRQEVLSPDQNERIEVTAYVAENEADRQKIIAEIKRIYRSDLAANPALETHFEAIRFPSEGRSPDSDDGIHSSLEEISEGRPISETVVSKEAASSLKARFGSWFKKNYRITFALTRGTLNAGVTTWGLLVGSGLPIEVALPTGIITGAMSASLQYWYGWLRDEFLHKSFAHLLPEKFRNTVKAVSPFSRWYLLEVGFVGVIDVVMTLLGAPTTNTPAKLAKTAAMALGSQGLLETGINRSIKNGLEKAVDSSKRARLLLKGDLLALGISVLSVSASIADMQGLPAGVTVFGSMAAGGTIFFAKVLYSEWRCRKNLKKEPPSREDERDAADLGAIEGY